MAHENITVTSESDNQEVIIIREFDAPREKVLHALADPEICEAWGLGQAAVSMTSVQCGDESSQGFPFDKSQDPKSIAEPIELSGMPKRGHGALEKIVFEEIVPEKTTVTMVLLCESITACGGWMKSGIGDMMAASFIKLDELLQKQ